MSLLSGIGSAEWILNAAARSLVISLLAVLVLRLLRKSSAPLRSAVCLLALGALLLLPLPPLSSSGGAVLALPSGSEAGIDPNAGDVRAASAMPAAIQAPAAVSFPASTEMRSPRSFTPLILIRWLNLFGLIWSLGFAFQLVRMGKGLASIRKLRRSARPIRSERLLRIFRTAAETVDAPSRIELLESSLIQGPQVIGIRRPAVLLPWNFSNGLTYREIRGVFLHEISHIRNRDTSIGVLQRLVGVGHWWNPLVKGISRRLSRAREEISDTHVLLRGDSREYAGFLIDLAERMGLREELPVSPCLVPCHLSLTERVKRILSKERSMDTTLKTSSRVPVLLAAVLCVGLAASFRLVVAAPGEAAPGQKAEVVWKEPGDLPTLIPRLIEKVDPLYPPASRGAGIQGVVLLKGRTDKEGRVDRIEIDRADDDVLKQAAVQAVLGWKFQPLTRDGRPSATAFNVKFDFELTEGRPVIRIRYSAWEDPGPPVATQGESRPPKLIKRVDPLYPQKALEAGVEGSVTLQVTIDVYGRVQSVDIRRSVPLLDQAAADAVEQWVFEPALVDGKPRSTTFSITLTFDKEKVQTGGVMGGVMGGVVWEVVSGRVGGVKGGIVGGVELPGDKSEGGIVTRRAGDAVVIIRADDGGTVPRILKLVGPVYPEIARQARVEGHVILEVTTDIYGRVEKSRILRSIPLLDQAAVDAVKQWVFEPLLVEGKPRPGRLIVSVVFRVSDLGL